MAEYKLELKGVSKSFPGVKALDNVQLSLRPGSVLALMGENGAGKSTLMKCLFGIYHMDAGEIYIDGEKVEIKDPDDAMEKVLQWYIRNCSLYLQGLLQRICILDVSRYTNMDHFRSLITRQ